MSSSSFESTVDLTPRPSIRALRWLLWLHILPIAATAFAMQPGLPMLAVDAAFGLSWIWLRRHPVFGFGPRALVRLVWHAEGQWTLTENSGRRYEAELLADSYVHPRLLLLNFRTEAGQRRTRALLGDELEAEQLRRLRARLLLRTASST